jgi:hypothetical protein
MVHKALSNNVNNGREYLFDTQLESVYFSEKTSLQLWLFSIQSVSF